MPSSAIQILEQTPGRLVIFVPPYYVFGVSFIMIALLIVSLIRWFMPEAAIGLIKWSGCLLAIPFLIAGTLALVSKTNLVFDRQTGTLTIMEHSLTGTSEKVIPLSDSQGAALRYGRHRASRGVDLVLKSGQGIRIIGYTDRAGYTAAIDAINAFLRG